MASSRVQGWSRIAKGPEQDFRVMRVREDLFRDPRNGAEHPRVIITSPEWVNVLALTEDDQAVLVRQYRAAVDQPTLELPGGLVDPDEAPERAAARELEEETGYRPGRIVPLGWIHPNPATHTNRCFGFLAEGCARVNDGRLDPGEDIQVELHPRSSLPKLVADGIITHACAVATLYLESLRRR